MHGINKLLKLCGYALIFIGVACILGWLLGVDFLTRLKAYTLPMAPDTAIMFILFGIYFANNSKAQLYKKVLLPSIIGFVALYGLLKFLELFLHIDLTFSNVLLPTSEKIGSFLVKRMSPLTGLLLFVSGLSATKIAFNQNKIRYNQIADILNSGVFLFAYIISVGYLFGIPFFYQGKIIPLALLTSIGFLIISIGLLLQNASYSIIIKKFTESSANIRLLRIIIPIIFVTVIFQGLLLDSVSSDNFLSHPLISAIMSLVLSLTISIIIFRISKIIFKRANELEISQKKAEIALKESESYFKAIFEDNSSAIAIIEADTTISMVNDAYCSMCGYSSEDVIGMSWTEQIPPDDLERLKEYNRRRLVNPSDAPEKYEFKFYLKNGTIRFGLMSISTINISNKIKFVASFADITERKIAEEALRISEERYALTINAVNDGLWDWNVETGDAAFSKNYYNILGYDDNEFIANYNNWKVLVHPDDIERVEQELNSGINMASGISIDLRMKMKSGNWLWVSIRGKTVESNEKGLAKRMLGTLSDVSIRKISEGLLTKQAEELEALNATKDKFFSIIAHDLKSPFNTILGFSNLLLMDYENMDSFEIKKILKSLDITSKNTFELLENLLVWAQSQTGHTSFKPEDIDATELISSILSLTHSTAHKKSIKIDSLVPKECYVYADINMLNTVFRNLIQNAIKFTPVCGTVIINAQKKDGNWVVSVKDNGIGIEESNLDKLFRIDSKFSSLGTENEIGTGLGLILCKEFVEKNGGTIEVYSQINTGSEFIVTLPSTNEINNNNNKT